MNGGSGEKNARNETLQGRVRSRRLSLVIPAQAGIHASDVIPLSADLMRSAWIPASEGMTKRQIAIDIPARRRRSSAQARRCRDDGRRVQTRRGLRVVLARHSRAGGNPWIGRDSAVRRPDALRQWIPASAGMTRLVASGRSERCSPTASRQAAPRPPPRPAPGHALPARTRGFRCSGRSGRRIRRRWPATGCR
jgi:hypothetical protein